MKIGIVWDEHYPIFHVENNLSWADATAEVTTEWLEEARVIERTYWALQDELRELSGYDQ